MKKLSIKMRVTIWYTVFIVLIAGMALFFVTSLSEQMLWSKTEGNLQEMVSEFADDLDMTSNGYEVEEEEVFYEDGVMFSLYDTAGRMQDGGVPDSFPGGSRLKNGEVQKVAADGKQWMTYDIAIRYGDNQIVWVRGITSSSMVSEWARMLLLIMCVSCPILITLAAVGGYFITRRAFIPVENIRAAADEIGRGQDLSKRISMEETKGEIQQLAETFNKMFERLETSFEGERRFTADASHELRTPTAVILSQCEYALLEDTTDAERKDNLKVIYEQADKISVLISQLLLLARNDHAEEVLEYIDVDLSFLAQMVVEEMEACAQRKGIVIQTEITPGLQVKGDQTGFMRILMNLIENSIQYGKEGGVTLVTVKCTREHVICQVADNGIGIPEAHMEDIFKRFYRVEKSRTSLGAGNAGLGLAMVKALVENFRGTIAVQSKMGEGSQFTCKFIQRKGSF